MKNHPKKSTDLQENAVYTFFMFETCFELKWFHSSLAVLRNCFNSI